MKIKTLVLIGLFILAGCSNDSDVNSSNSYTGTQSPGDVWSWTIDATSFSAKNETLEYSYSGSKSTLPNKFLKLIVDTSDDPALVGSLPATAYAIENPGTALIIKPAGTDGKVIVAVAKGTCPSSDSSFNWVVIPKLSWSTLSSDEAYGTATSTVSGSMVDFTGTKNELDGTPIAGGGVSSFDCSDGVITSAVDPIVFAVAPTGTMIGDNGPGAGGIVGVVAPGSAIVDSDFSQPGREFRGVLFKNNAPGDDTNPVWVRGQGTTLKGGGYTDFVVGTEDSANNVELVLVSQASPGLYNATLAATGISCPDPACFDFVLMVNKVGGKYVAYGIAENDDGSGGAYNVMLMEQ